MSAWIASLLVVLAGSGPPAVVVPREVMSERELVERAQGGDVAAFEDLYRLHEARVYGLCLRMVADPTRAEDLTQDAFVRAWQNLPSFRGQSAFSTWLHRLTVNVVLGDLRARRRRPHEASTGDEALETLDRGPRRLPEEGIDLERAVAALPSRARVVFVLHDIEGYRHREIAEMTGIAEGTSKAHLHRARIILRKALEP